MKKRLVALLAGMLIISGSCALNASERTYASLGAVIKCTSYDSVYDARGNIKNPGWYMPFEQDILTNRELQEQLTIRKVTALVGRRPTAEKIVKRESIGIPTIQFSHQFITDRSLGKSKVCRVYYMMTPYEDFRKKVLENETRMSSDEEESSSDDESSSGSDYSSDEETSDDEDDDFDLEGELEQVVGELGDDEGQQAVEEDLVDPVINVPASKPVSMPKPVLPIKAIELTSLKKYKQGQKIEAVDVFLFFLKDWLGKVKEVGGKLYKNKPNQAIDNVQLPYRGGTNYIGLSYNVCAQFYNYLNSKKIQLDKATPFDFKEYTSDFFTSKYAHLREDAKGMFDEKLDKELEDHESNEFWSNAWNYGTYDMFMKNLQMIIDNYDMLNVDIVSYQLNKDNKNLYIPGKNFFEDLKKRAELLSSGGAAYKGKKVYELFSPFVESVEKDLQDAKSRRFENLFGQIGYVNLIFNALLDK